MEFIMVGYLVDKFGTPILTAGEFDGKLANAKVTGAIRGEDAKQLFERLKAVTKKN